MASNYNRRLLAPEVLVDDDRWEIIRRRQTIDDLACARNMMRGLLVAFEGLDQSGKQTQAEQLRDRLVESGRQVRLLSFPAYDTPIGTEIRRALHGDREWGADVMQLLYIANRYERDRSSSGNWRRA